MPQRRDASPAGVKPGSTDAAAVEEPSGPGDAVAGSETEDNALEQGASGAQDVGGERRVAVDAVVEPDGPLQGCTAGGLAEASGGAAVPLDSEMEGACLQVLA